MLGIQWGWTGTYTSIVCTYMLNWNTIKIQCVQLGYGDAENRGDGANEMGDYLGGVDVGAGFNVEQVSCGNYHTCAVSTNAGITSTRYILCKGVCE